MSNESGKHLSSEQISWWLEEGEAGRFASTDRRAREAVEAHLSGCGYCAGLLVNQKSVAEDMRRLEVQLNAERTTACPAEEKWPEVAAGLSASDEARMLLQHAAQCDYCGPLLRAALEDMNSELSADDVAMLSQLPSAGPVGQADLARRMAQTSRSGGPVESQQKKEVLEWARWWRFLPISSAGHGLRWAPAAAVMIAIVAVAVWIIQLPGITQVEELLAKAYTADRQLELRIPGAEYAPLQQNPTTRGDASRIKKNRDLRRAQDEIDEHLQKNPNDLTWQQADAVGDMLRGDSDGAIATLEKLQRLQPDSAQLMNDLGIAYFQRSQVKKDPSEVLVALDWLARAYQATGNNPDPVIVFNYALVLEKAQQYQNAKSIWLEYRNLDRTSQWGVEAQRHIDLIDEILKQHALGEFEPDSDSEAFLDEAISGWLPAAFPLSSLPNKQARERLEMLSQSLQRQHFDNWLRQLLDDSDKAGFSQAINALAVAVRKNTSSRYLSASQDAAIATKLFAQIGNEAGWERSEVERIYALHHAEQVSSCLQASQELAIRLQARGYHWIDIQNQLELHSCGSKLKSLPPQALDLDNISGVASRFHYTFLQLRALGFIADEAADTDPGKCVRASLEGLRIYWSTPFAPRMRAYGLYESLAALAENSGSWELAYDFNREAALALPEGAYQLYTAMAWTRTAQLAMVLGRKQATQDAVARSAQLLAQVPEPETVALYKADGNISLARMQLEQGNTAAANNALSEAERLLPHDQNSNKIQVTNYTITLPFYTARARVAMALPHPDWPTARDALDSARSFAEQTLASLEDYHERLRLAREAAAVYREQVVLDLDYAQSPQQALKDWERFKLFPDPGTNPGESFTGKFLDGVLEAAYRAPAQTPIPEVFIAFVSTPDKTAALMVRPDGNVYGGWCTGSARKLRKTEAAFRRAIADPSTNLNAVHSQAKALSAVLLGPIYEFLPERAVLIVQPDEGAGEVPFYALVDQHGNYLAQHYTIVITPHPPSSWSLPKGAPPDGRALAVRVEQTYGKRSLGDLTPEVAAVRSAYRQMVELANAQATRKDIAQELRTAAVFHFAGHSLELPESVGVSVWGNDAIDGHFVSSTPMPNLKLVVLAACSTAHSRFASGDDDSLVGAFLAHGVPYVVATDWDVNSAATELYVQALYRQLASGVSVPEAVRLASLDLQEGKSTALPFYWAGFGVFVGGS